MKPITNLAIFLFAINGLLSTNFSEAKLKNKVHKKKITKSKKQVNLVHDQNHFHSSINQVVRRNPTLTVETKLGAERLAQPEAMLHMSNSNTSNGYNLGSFGQRAELVEPHMVVHSKRPISVITEQPAHIGYRNEQKTLTTLNRATGKMEQHTGTHKTPIFGNIQKVDTVYNHHKRDYDLETKRWGNVESKTETE